MNEAHELAEKALSAVAEMWSQTGLTENIGALVSEVWRVNLARYEPEELADNARTLGFVCSENLSGRVERLVRGHQYETEQWGVAGLEVARPQGALRMDLAGRHHYVMKAPMVYGRTPQWDSLVSWDAESNTRQTIAQVNTRALAGYRTPAQGQEGLFPILVDGELGAVANFMLVWAGDPSLAATAGWLTVPILGEVPFAAVRRLWWDDEVDSPVGVRRRGPEGPSFDERSAVAPAVTLKPRPGRTGEA